MTDHDLIVFLHIPMVLGASAKNYFRGNCTGSVLWLGEDFTRDDLIKWDDQKFQYANVIGGHFSYSLTTGIKKGKIYVSIITDPIIRAINLYRYIQNTNSHHLHIDAKKQSMQSLIENNPIFRSQINNLQVKFLSGLSIDLQHKGNFQTALDNINNNNFYVASEDNVQTLFNRLFSDIGGNFLYNFSLIRNYNQSDKIDELFNDESLIDKINSLNDEDKKLFNYFNKPGLIVTPEGTVSEHPDSSHLPEKLVFMHIPKTGGTSLHDILTNLVHPELICPERYNTLKFFDHNYLNQYFFFSGHYDWESVSNIPGKKKIFTILREPKARILSLYHFWRSHTWKVIEEKNLGGPRLAKTLDLVDFLASEDPGIVGNIDNALVRNLIGPVYIGPDRGFLYPSDEVVQRALRNLEAMVVVGVLENPDYGITHVLNKLDLPVPAMIPRSRDSTKFAEQPNMEFVEKQPVSEEAEELLKKLTVFDRIIYEHYYRKYSSNLIND